MKLSEISLDDVRKYIRIADDETEDNNLINSIMAASRSFILNYTGLTAEKADEISEFYYAFLCLCSDMYNTRDLYVQQDKLNPAVKCILDMHRENCIG